MTFQERYALAKATQPGDVWRHRKTGKEVVIIARRGFYGLDLSHPSGRRSTKRENYLASDYEKVEPTFIETA